MKRSVHKGMSLAVIIFISALLFGMAVVATQAVFLNKGHALDTNIREQCRYAASAGLQRGLRELAVDSGIVQFTNPPQSPPPTIDDSLAADPKLRYTVQLLANGTPQMIKAPDDSDIPPGAVYIYSVGYIEGSSTRVSISGYSALAIRAKPVFDFAGLADGAIDIQSDSWIDAWNSALSAYPGTSPFNPADSTTYTKAASLATNMGVLGAIRVAGNTAIDGDLLVAPDATDPAAIVQLAGSVTLTGTPRNQAGTRRIPLWEPTLDPRTARNSVTVAAGTSYTLPPGAYRDLSAGSSGGARATLILTAGDYYFDRDIDLANVDLQIDPSTTAPVVLYVKGDLDVTAQSRLNVDTAGVNGKPANLQVYFVGSDTTFKVDQASSASLVASGAQTHGVLDTGEIFGAIMAQDITMRGANSKIHYDQSLAGLKLNGNGKWALVAIKERSGKSKGKGGGNSGGSNGGGNSGGSNSGGSNNGGSTSGGSNSGGSTSGGSTTGGSTSGGSTSGGSTTGGSTSGGSTSGGSTSGGSTSGGSTSGGSTSGGSTSGGSTSGGSTTGGSTSGGSTTGSGTTTGTSTGTTTGTNSGGGNSGGGNSGGGNSGGGNSGGGNSGGGNSGGGNSGGGNSGN